jgi:LPXTG-motif cell wall-anchored protein
VKKSIAAISASILGFGAAAAAGAAPAQAATLPPCNEASDHTASATVDPATDDWYMTCAPVYGMGKAEFTITTDAAHPFPAGYSLADGHQTVTSSAPPKSEVKRYFGADFWHDHNIEVGFDSAASYGGAFMNLEKTSGTSTSQTYGDDPSASKEMSVAYRVASFGKATDPFPAACFPAGARPAATYQGEYEVKYLPTTTTWVQVLKGVKRKVTVTYTPSPLFLGLNFDTTGDANSVDNFDSSMPQCASSGGITVQAASHDDDSDSWDGVVYNSATNNPQLMSTLVPQPATSSSPQTIPPLGSFTVTTTAVPTTPELAVTGFDAIPIGLAGGGLLLAGIGTLFVGRRRRHTSVIAR